MNRWIELFEDDRTYRVSMPRVLAFFTTVTLAGLIVLDAVGFAVSEGLVGMMMSGYAPLLNAQLQEGLTDRKAKRDENPPVA